MSRLVQRSPTSVTCTPPVPAAVRVATRTELTVVSNGISSWLPLKSTLWSMASCKPSRAGDTSQSSFSPELVLNGQTLPATR